MYIDIKKKHYGVKNPFLVVNPRTPPGSFARSRSLWRAAAPWLGWNTFVDPQWCRYFSGFFRFQNVKMCYFRHHFSWWLRYLNCVLKWWNRGWATWELMLVTSQRWPWGNGRLVNGWGVGLQTIGSLLICVIITNEINSSYTGIYIYIYIYRECVCERERECTPSSRIHSIICDRLTCG